MKYIISICFIFIFVLLLFPVSYAISNDNTCSENVKPDWVLKGPSYDDENIMVIGSAEMESLEKGQDYAMSDAFINFINFCYLSYLRKYPIDKVISRYHLQPEDTPQASSALCKHLEPFITKYNLQDTYYEEMKKTYKVWVRINIKRTNADNLIKEISKYENKDVSVPTVLIAFRYIKDGSIYKLERIQEIEDILKKEFKKFGYNIVENPLSMDDLPTTKNIEKIMIHLGKMYKKTPIQRMIWCQLNENVNYSPDSSGERNYLNVEDSLTIREIKIKPPIIIRLIDRRAKSVTVEETKEDNAKKEAFKKLLEDLPLKKQDFADSYEGD